MRALIRHAVAVVAAAGALLGAKSAMAATGVIFVHGTGDYTTSTAKTDYWTQASIDSMRAGRNYLVVGYQGASCAGFDSCSWGSITDQMGTWISANGITDVVVVTHSNGSSPVRYMLAHTGAVSPGGRTVSSVTSKFRKVIYSAPDLTGTPLADSVTSSGSMAAIANSVVSFFGGGSYNKPAVWQQRTDRMRNTYNTNGTFAGSAGATLVGGVSAQIIRGTNVYAAVWSGDAYCGGYSSTTGLKAALIYGWGYSGCSDGFIGCDSSGWFGSIVQSDDRLNHNQSRRSCHNAGANISNNVSNTIGYTAPPADYTVSPGAQACNATVSGWKSASPYAGNFYWYGCSSSQHGDTATDVDCLAAYGTDNNVSVPDDFASTGYANASYYSSGTACPDSWRGDGECDLCLLAKYGYDAKEGSASGADDCVNAGAGTVSKCGDLAYYDQTSAIGYYSYTVTH
jgi:hypothetical protein